MPDCQIAANIAPSGLMPFFLAMDSTGAPSLITNVSDNNASQTLTVLGNPSGGGFTATFGGRTTTTVPAIPSPPAAYWRWNFTVPAGSTRDLAVNIFQGGTASPHCTYDIFDG